MPKSVIDRWKRELEHEVDEERKKQLYWRSEKYIDQSYGQCFLRLHAIATIIRDAIKYYDGIKYKLISWVIMPNHIHILLRPADEVELASIMHSIKSFSAQKANKALGRSGQFWQIEYYDRYIRDAKHFNSVIRYIEMNPVKAGLCKHSDNWEFGSAYERAQAGSTEEG